MGVFWFFKTITGVRQKIMNKFNYLLKCIMLFTLKRIFFYFLLLIYFISKRKNLLLKIIKPYYFLIMKNLMLIINKKKIDFKIKDYFILNKV